MTRKILFLLLFILIFASFCFAAKPNGKLYIYPQNPTDTVYVDGLLVSQGVISIEALEEGDYLVQIDNEFGKSIYNQRVDIRANQTTTIKVGEITPPIKGAVQYTPTFSISLGYHFLTVSGTFPNVGTVTNASLSMYGISPNMVSLELNKDLTDSLELQLGYYTVSGRVMTANASADININSAAINLRHVWERSGWYKANYIGGGISSNTWNGVGSGTGYQFFYGGYSNPLGYAGCLQTEIGLVSLSGGSGASAGGFYAKVGWAF